MATLRSSRRSRSSGYQGERTPSRATAWKRRAESKAPPSSAAAWSTKKWTAAPQRRGSGSCRSSAKSRLSWDLHGSPRCQYPNTVSSAWRSSGAASTLVCPSSTSRSQLKRAPGSPANPGWRPAPDSGAPPEATTAAPCAGGAGGRPVPTEARVAAPQSSSDDRRMRYSAGAGRWTFNPIRVATQPRPEQSPHFGSTRLRTRQSMQAESRATMRRSSPFPVAWYRYWGQSGRPAPADPLPLT